MKRYDPIIFFDQGGSGLGQMEERGDGDWVSLDDASALLALLRDTDRRMTGNELYEHGWANHPEKPERSAADYVREVING